MARKDHTTIITRNGYPILIIIMGVAVLSISLLTGGEFAFFIVNPLSIVIIGVGAALTAKRNNKSKGLAKHQRFILFCIAMVLLAFFAYFLIVIYRVVLT